MSSSKSSPKRGDRTSFKPVSPFAMFYQLTYLSAMASAGITRSKTFELAASTHNDAAEYFVAINRLVDEFRFDYPEACRRVGNQAKSDNMKSFLLRLSDALSSGEPLADYLAREAHVQGEDYENHYERNVEALKQWSNAFTSIVISVALIVIIQVITSMIYSMDKNAMLMMVGAGALMSAFSAWIIYRSAPQEIITAALGQGSAEQIRVYRMARVLVPLGAMSVALAYVVGLPIGYLLLWLAVLLAPIGVLSFMSDRQTTKKDVEFSTFLRSAGGMTTSSGTTIKQALLRLDLSSFPVLKDDVERLSMRLQALVEPELCWRQFGRESGSRLIHEVTDIFYGGIKIGGDPERVGYLCSLFTAKTTQLRAKRRLTAGTFGALAVVMQGVVAGLMVFVHSVVMNFADMVENLMPSDESAAGAQAQMRMSMADFTPDELVFLTNLTGGMVLLLAAIGALAIIFSDGGFRLKIALYLAITLMISGVAFLIVPPLVDSIVSI